MVDATDLKSVDRKVVWVQVPSPPSHFMRDSIAELAIAEGVGIKL